MSSPESRTDEVSLTSGSKEENSVDQDEKLANKKGTTEEEDNKDNKDNKDNTDSDEINTKDKSSADSNDEINTKDKSSADSNEKTSIINTHKDNESPKPKKKSVGFAPEPEEDLKEHHRRLKQIEMEKARSNPFHKIPPELSYLERKTPGPKPIGVKKQSTPSGGYNSKTNLPDLKDLKFVAIKDISVQNKDTELNFNYPEFERPIAAYKVLVDIKYVSLNSFDLAKINKYALNLSNTKVGLGYEFAGEIAMVGASLQDDPNYAVGTKVVGILTPYERKGSLSTSLVMNPATDVIQRVDEDTLEKLKLIDINLSFRATGGSDQFDIGSSSSSSSSDSEDEVSPPPPAQDPTPKLPAKSKRKVNTYQVEEVMPPLAKLSAFPVLYTRAKQALSHVEPIIHQTGRANILINGADTNLGYTILQILFSSLYSQVLKHVNVILIIREVNHKRMKHLTNNISKLHYNPQQTRHINLIPFDLENEDIMSPGEVAPINYKKLDFFASEVLGGLFSSVPPGEAVTKFSVDEYKLDSIIDVVGSKRFFQKTGVRFKKLDEINLPFKQKIYQDLSLNELFRGNVSEAFLVKILKPKAKNSSLVSMCRFSVKEPSYEVDTLHDYSGEGLLNPWSSKWSSSIANSLVGRYNYYEEIGLKIRKEWVDEGLRLLLENELKFKIDHFIDWRNNFRSYVKDLKKDDGKVVFKVEDF